MKVYIFMVIIIVILACMLIIALFGKEDRPCIGNLVISDTPEGLEMYIQLSSDDLEALKKEQQIALNVVVR